MIKNNPKHIDEVQEYSTKFDGYLNEIKAAKGLIDYSPINIFDIGANIGGMAEAYTRIFPNATVYAFEPVAETFDRLKKNTEMNEKIKVYNFGLYSEDKENVPIGIPKNPLRRNPYNMGLASIFYESIEIGGIEQDWFVDYVTLKNTSSWCVDNNIFPDFIKIDAEGCEYDILKNLNDSGILSRVGCVQVELNGTFGETTELAKKLLIKDYDVGLESSRKLDYIFIRKRRNNII